MDRKRLFLLASTAIVVMVFVAACSPSAESVQKFRLADLLGSFQSAPAQPAPADSAVVVEQPTLTAEVAAAAVVEATPTTPDTGVQSVSFASPVDGAEVSSPFSVTMAATGLTVEPAGEIHEGAGHMHILVDEPFVDPGDVILSADNMLHFGKGQLATTLDLTPGEHTLRLQFANGAHIALDGDQYRDEIKVVVTEPGEQMAHDHAHEAPSVFFVSPIDGATVTSPFEVQMTATGLTVEPAGEIHEGAGHMHILVDEAFVDPGDVILTTDTLLHFGKGQLATTLDLAPGEHTLRLQFADGAHIALDGDQYRDEIKVVVAEAPQEPSVWFASPVDGAEVSSPFSVTMAATGLNVEPAGEIHEGAGHMHILVDEPFVDPGDVILTTDTLLHFGKGQLATTLDLAPGEHTLRLQFADGAHIALDGDQYRDEIKIVVAEPGDEVAAAIPSEPSVSFVSPIDGAEVSSPFSVTMAATGLNVEPAGEIHEGAGHMHILIDEPFVEAGEVILSTDNMLHFGKGQLSTTLDLAPGEHTLRLQFANGAHIALDGDQYRDEIKIMVAEAPQEPSVFFISPVDGAEVYSPFEVTMGATGLNVEPAGEIHEGAGHMHILVDEPFVDPGDVILTTDTLLHFGKGQLATTLDLAPGEHTLRLQFADGAHIALDGDQYRDEIKIVVE